MEKDPFQQAYRIKFFEEQIIIKKAPKRSYLTIALAVILIPFFCFMLFVSLVEFLDKFRFWDFVGCLIILGIIMLVVRIVWNSNSNGPYPITEISVLGKSVFKQSQFPFYDDKLETFSRINDISFRTKAVGGSVSSYEEGDTDYRKSLVLETDKGDIPLLTYYARNADPESTLQHFADLLKQKLTNTSE